MERTLINVVKARREGGETSKYKDLLQLMIDTTGEEELEGEQSEGRWLATSSLVATNLSFQLVFTSYVPMTLHLFIVFAARKNIV